MTRRNCQQEGTVLLSGWHDRLHLKNMPADGGNCSQLFIIGTDQVQEIAFSNDQQQKHLELLLLSGSNQQSRFVILQH